MLSKCPHDYSLRESSSSSSSFSHFYVGSMFDDTRLYVAWPYTSSPASPSSLISSLTWSNHLLLGVPLFLVPYFHFHQPRHGSNLMYTCAQIHLISGWDDREQYLRIHPPGGPRWNDSAAESAPNIPHTHSTRYIRHPCEANIIAPQIDFKHYIACIFHHWRSYSNRSTYTLHRYRSCMLHPRLMS